MDMLNPPHTFMWIPSHVGIFGNEMADKLAKQGTARAAVDTQLPLGTKEKLPNIAKYTQKLLCGP